MLINNKEKRAKSKKAFAVLLILVLIMGAFAGCGDDDGKTEDATPPEEVPQGDLAITLSIDFPDNSGLDDIEDKPMALPEGGTVLDLIYSWANESSIELTFDKDDPETQYLQAIGDIKETKSEGWTYEVNDEMVMTAIGATPLKNGDEVEFEFVSW